MNHPKNSNQPPKARRGDLVVQELPNEALVYDLKRHKAHCLNETAAFVWNHCDGKTSAAEIAALMEEERSKPADEDVVWLALKQLSRAELLQERIAPSEEGMRASRRSLLGKLGAAAAMTPLVISIIAPTASAGASVPVECQACIKHLDTTAQCPPVCANFPGSCFQNDGCGSGRLAGNPTCLQCQQMSVHPLSWTAP
jgi:hypothetical protein